MLYIGAVLTVSAVIQLVVNKMTFD